MSKKHQILLSVTDQQEHAIVELFSQNKWKYTNLLPTSNPQTVIKRRKLTKDTASHQETSQQPPNEPPGPPPSPPEPHPLEGEQQECPECFLTPCATAHDHYWLGEGQPEHRENHGVRKIKYRSYWKFINNSGGWNDNRYLLKKVAIRGQVNDKRELMPSCVVAQLRALYPNPSDMPYMGHMWI